MNTPEALQFILRMRRSRWDAGKDTYRGGGDVFVGDARKELIEELVDGLNYLAQLTTDDDMEMWRVSSIEHHIMQAALLVLGHTKE